MLKYWKIKMYVLPRAKKTGRQNHVLTQQKMFHCKTVVTYQSYHHVVWRYLSFFLFFWHFIAMDIIRQGKNFNLWQSNEIFKWPEFFASDSKFVSPKIQNEGVAILNYIPNTPNTQELKFKISCFKTL
jgi:hypothetical protein